MLVCNNFLILIRTNIKLMGIYKIHVSAMINRYPTQITFRYKIWPQWQIK